MFKIVLLFLFKYLYSMPLGREVLEYLEKDVITFNTYRKDYLELSCKLTIYSKLKYMWEIEELDKYLNKTTLSPRDYINRVREEMMKKCMADISNINVKFYNFRMFLMKSFMSLGKKIMNF
jgi:hypothetical protein